jgi:hypothetical protein
MCLVAETPSDRELVAYQAVRAHELMLNEAVSRFEHARLAPLIALNGGAVVAFLTLLGVLLGKDSGRHPNLWVSGLAVGAWVFGLVAAALATTAATGQQRATSAAHRLLREQLEDALLSNDGVKPILPGPQPSMDRPSSLPRGDLNLAAVRRWWTGEAPPTASAKSNPAARPQMDNSRDEPTTRPPADNKRDRDAEREELRKIGSIYARRLKARWWLSVTMFVAGGVLALAAIVSGSPVSKPPRTQATISQAARTQVSTSPSRQRLAFTGIAYWMISGSCTSDAPPTL